MIACCFDLVQVITALMLARILSMFIAQIIGLLIWRHSKPNAPRPFKMWLYPFPALFALAGWIMVFVTPALQPGGWRYMLYAFGTIIAGFAAFLILAFRKREWPFGNTDPDLRPAPVPVLGAEGPL
jgi:L-asparagine transporter-like permease